MDSQALTINACWNRIGVAGDQSCAKLLDHVHCRNCEVYAGAAQHNLQRPVDDGYKQLWAGHFRRAGADARGGHGDNSALVFRVGREWLALPTRIMLSVTPQARPHTVPHRKGLGLIGVVNVGGKLYPCVALAALLDIDEQEPPPAKGRHTFARLLLLEWEGQAYALPVAELEGIVRYAGAAVEAPAATINKGLSRFLAGVLRHADRHVGCLDVALLGDQLARALR